MLCPRDGERVVYVKTDLDLAEEGKAARRRQRPGGLRIAPEKKAPRDALVDVALEAPTPASTEAEDERGPVEEAPEKKAPRDEGQEPAAEAQVEAKAEEAPAGSTSLGSKEPPAPRVGDTLGAYELVEVIGEGGMGTVFRGRHSVLGRQDALKVLLPEFCTQPAVVHRFFHEAQAVNLIRHPNIVDIQDFVESESEPPEHPPYMVMELLTGSSLSRYIRAHTPLPVPDAVAIATQVCAALAAVHGEGVVHRDLKPDNVVVAETEDGLRVKLLDFGVAKFITGKENFLKTLTGAAVGTPEYMAPEQIIGEEVDHRIDVYALGVILYEMLTGRQPFVATTIGELVTAHLSEPPRSPSERLVERGGEPLPPAVEQTVLACLAKEPADRMPDMETLRRALQACVDDPRAAVDVLAQVPALRGARSSSWRHLAGVALVVAVVVGGGLYAMLGGRGSDARTPRASEPQTTPMDVTTSTPPAAGMRLVEVVSHPAGAAIIRARDGQFLGRTPTKVVVSRDSSLALRLRKQGYRELETTVSWGNAGPVRITLAAETAMDAMAPTTPRAGAPAPRKTSHRRRRRPAAMHRPERSSPRREPPMARPGMRDLGGTVDPFKR